MYCCRERHVCKYVYMYIPLYVHLYICTGTSLPFPQKKNVMTFFFLTPDFFHLVGVRKKKECEQIARTGFFLLNPISELELINQLNRTRLGGHYIL